MNKRDVNVMMSFILALFFDFVMPYNFQVNARPSLLVTIRVDLFVHE